MADGEDIQPLVCDNGTGMVKVRDRTFYDFCYELIECDLTVINDRRDSPEMMLRGLCFRALLGVHVTPE